MVKGVTANKLSNHERKVKENLAFKSGMRGQEHQPERFQRVPNQGQELAPLEKPVMAARERGTENPEYSLLGGKNAAPELETAEGRGLDARASGDADGLGDSAITSPTLKSAGGKGGEMAKGKADAKPKGRVDDGDEDDEPEGGKSEEKDYAFKSGMRGQEKPRKK